MAIKKKCNDADLMKWIDLICHRKPERCFFIKGHHFPVCARCTGFYISLVTYYLYTYYNYVDYTHLLLITALLLLVPVGVDGTTQFIGLRESNNILRLCTGLIGGIGLGIIIKSVKFLLF